MNNIIANNFNITVTNGNGNFKYGLLVQDGINITINNNNISTNLLINNSGFGIWIYNTLGTNFSNNSLYHMCKL